MEMEKHKNIAQSGKRSSFICKTVKEDLDQLLPIRYLLMEEQENTL